MRAMKDQIQYCFKFSSIQRKREPYIFYLFQGTHIEGRVNESGSTRGHSRKNSCASSESVNVHSSPPSLVTLFALPVFHNLILENDGAPERRWLTARGIPGGRGRKPCPYCCRFAPTIPPRRLRMIVATAVEITVAKGVAKRSGVIITPILGFIFGIEGFKGD